MDNRANAMRSWIGRQFDKRKLDEAETGRELDELRVARVLRTAVQGSDKRECLPMEWTRTRIHSYTLNVISCNDNQTRTVMQNGAMAVATLIMIQEKLDDT